MRRFRSAAKVLSAICREQRKPTPNRFHATLLFNLNARQTVFSQSRVPFYIQPYASGNKDIPNITSMNIHLHAFVTRTCRNVKSGYLVLVFCLHTIIIIIRNYKKHKINYY